MGKWKKRKQPQEFYIPLSFEPGQDAQCDWGEAMVVMGGKEVIVQVFVMRMCYSRRLFVMAFRFARSENVFCLGTSVPLPILEECRAGSAMIT